MYSDLYNEFVNLWVAPKINLNIILMLNNANWNYGKVYELLNDSMRSLIWPSWWSYDEDTTSNRRDSTVSYTVPVNVLWTTFRIKVQYRYFNTDKDYPAYTWIENVTTWEITWPSPIKSWEHLRDFVLYYEKSSVFKIVLNKLKELEFYEQQKEDYYEKAFLNWVFKEVDDRSPYN